MICSDSNRVSNVGLDTSMIGVSAITVISSENASDMVKSTDATLPRATRTSSAAWVWWPARLAITLKVPIGRAGIMKPPDSLVTAVRWAAPRTSPVTTIVTPGRACPSASTVLPRMLPVVWAETEKADNRINPLSNQIVVRRLFIPHPPQWY